MSYPQTDLFLAAADEMLPDEVAVDAMSTARASHSFLGIDMEGRTCVVQTTGNAYGHLILRGGVDGTNYSSSNVAAVQGQLTGAGLPPSPCGLPPSLPG